MKDRQLLAKKGTPQGGVLSPLLANIYLHPLDKYWVQNHNGWKTKLIRYCDDFVILIRDESLEPYMHSLQSILSKLKLNLSEEKTRVVEASEGFDFLGARLVRKSTRGDRNRFFCYCFPHSKAMKAMRQKIRHRLLRKYQISLEDQIQLLNPLLRGWANYYHWMNSGESFHKVERYVIKKLYRWNCRKHGGKRKNSRIYSGDLYRLGLYRFSGTIHHVY